MAEKIIRSHNERAKQVNEMLKTEPYYNCQRISIVNREAFVEFLLLEDINRLYNIRLKQEKAYIPKGRADEKGKQLNIEKFSAIIKIFDAAIGVARAAIQSGDYKKVWKAIHEGALMAASKNGVKNLPELRQLAVDMLRDILGDTVYAREANSLLEEDLDNLDAHEENVRRFNDLPSMPDGMEEVVRNDIPQTADGMREVVRNDLPLTLDKIEEVIRVAEEVIPDHKKINKNNPNI